MSIDVALINIWNMKFLKTKLQFVAATSQLKEVKQVIFIYLLQ